jgi:predicted ATPase
MLQLAEGADVNATGPGAAAWLARMEAEHDNLRAALDWSASGDRELYQHLAAAWGPFWMTRGHFAAGCQRLSEALAGASDQTLASCRWPSIGSPPYVMTMGGAVGLDP